MVTPVGVPTWGEPVLQWGLALDDIQVRSDANIGNVDVLGSGDDILFYNPSESSAGLYNSYLYRGWAVPWFDGPYWPNAE